MIKKISLKKQFDKKELLALLNRSYLDDENKLGKVRKIIKRITKGKDKALFAILEEIEGQSLNSSNVAVDQKTIDDSQEEVDSKLLSSLKEAASRIRDYHRKQITGNWFIEEDGIKSGQIVSPIKRVGVYVPGGGASYPSSLLMNVIPAQIAGVEEIIVCTPANSSSEVDKVVLAAASLLGVKKIFKVGGAQAIAAMAYGTETIEKVNKITGPGNIYVTLAKKEVNGVVGIDMLAGPSEVLIFADEKADPSIVASDVLAQAEHGEDSMAIVVTDSKKLAKLVEKEVEVRLEQLTKKESAKRSLDRFGLLITAENLSVGIEAINLIGPEHLLIYRENAKKIVREINNAGAIFVGKYSAVALGDYAAGPNHTLPTMGSAAFSSPLSVDDFVKKSSYLEVTGKGLKKLAPIAEKIAKAEGLDAHAKSIQVRREK